jgi:hypothetical protein
MWSIRSRRTGRGFFTITGRITFTRETRKKIIRSLLCGSGKEMTMLDTLAKQFVPALEQNYRYFKNRKILEFDDGTEYSLREAVLIARERPKDGDLQAIHLVKRVFDGVVSTEREITDFMFFNERMKNENNQPKL